MGILVVLKTGFFMVCLGIVFPFVALSSIDRFIVGRQLFFDFSAQSLSLVPGLFGVYLRAAFYFSTLKKCSWDLHLGFGSYFSRRGAVIGKHVTTSAYCVIGDVEIGNEVLIGSRVSVTSGKRHHLDESGKLSRFSEIVYDTVHIGENSWIGEGSIVMADIGSRCMVAAGSVVSASMPDESIIGGNPAKVLKSIHKEDHR